jgi:CheY-like chemotaxis protein
MWHIARVWDFRLSLFNLPRWIKMKRILVADDSPGTRLLIAAALNGLGDIAVERASSGLEALKILTTMQVDLVLTDVHMPELNGLELLRLIKRNERISNTPVVIMSTEAEDADRERGVAGGADDFLPKPFTADQLRNLIEKHLSGV